MLQKSWFRALLVALSMAVGACAPLEDDALNDAAEAADEVRTPTWERFVGAWEQVQGPYVGIVFTRESTGGTSHRYFADRQVFCVRAPCPPARETGTFRATTRYLYLTAGGETTRYSHTLSGTTLTLRDGQRVVAVLRKVQSYCGTDAADCRSQDLPAYRCLGGFVCTAEHRCVYRCGPPPTTCRSNAECGAGRYCQASTCGGSGTCAARPDACAEIYAPVCGCDGRTYGNRCEAASAGVNVATTGECRPAPGRCTRNADCGATQYCQAASCGGTGTCATRPEICITLYAPVCGCDGRTYSNSCRAASAGVIVASQGACR